MDSYILAVDHHTLLQPRLRTSYGLGEKVIRLLCRCLWLPVVLQLILVY